MPRRGVVSLYEERRKRMDCARAERSFRRRYCRLMHDGKVTCTAGRITVYFRYEGQEKKTIRMDPPPRSVAKQHGKP